MKLPNAESAFVDMQKLTDYLLDPDHPRGKHKARVFAAACGITANDADFLRQVLLTAAQQGDAALRRVDIYGQRFVIEWEITGVGGQVKLVTAWIIRHGEDFPRFVSANVK
jgi:hypothetical protein